MEGAGHTASGWSPAAGITPLVSRLHNEWVDVAMVCDKTGKSGEYTITCE